MIRVRLSRPFLRWAGAAGGIVVLSILFYLLGAGLTPRDVACRPLILSPSVYNAERYRRATLGWVATAEEMDEGLTALLAQQDLADPAQLYALSRQAQELISQATTLAQETTFTLAPPAQTTSSEQAQAVASGYLDAALAAARWIGEPTPENRRATLETLRAARGWRTQLAGNRWLTGLGRQCFGDKR